MIRTKDDLRAYMKADLHSWKGRVPNIVDWMLNNESWYIYHYIRELRHVEYYYNSKASGLCFRTVLGRVIFAYHYWRFKRLGFKLRYHIYPNTIGPGLMIWHTGDFIHVKRACKIGKNCVLRPGVVIGKKNDEDEFDMPVVVGDNVKFGLGVRVFGKLNIGNNVTIGANSVVTKDIPDNAVVGGIPARIIRIKNE